MLRRVPPTCVHRFMIAFVITVFVAWPIIASAQGLNGTYTGTYRCGQNVTNMKLSVTTTAAGELTGHFTVYLPAGTQTQAYTYGVFGQFNPTTAKFVLNGTQWEGARPANAVMVGMNGTWDSNELTGTITGGANCTFQLERGQDTVARATTPATPATAPASPARTQANAKPPATSPTARAAAPSPSTSNPPSRETAANLEQAKKALAEAEKEADKADQAYANPVLRWSLITKKDRLSDETTTQLGAMTGLMHGDYIQANALCNDNGIAVFFTLGSLGSAKSPEFSWDQNQTSGDPTMDVRMRVDGRPVHVAQGYPDKKGTSVFANTLGLLFYEPNLVARTAREQRDAARTGVAGLDSLIGGLVGSAAQVNAENLAASSAGPLSELLDAKSIRVELPVNGYFEAPILDLNPQNAAFHKFATDCSSHFSGPSQPRATAQPSPSAAPTTSRSGSRTSR